jgi:tRNA pseudouridine55 synthase
MLTEGFLNLLKPPGMTSHDLVVAVRVLFGRVAGCQPALRVGHLGTLDPAAGGVLPIALGRATRLFQFAGGTQKVYRAEITFGVTTDTLDAEGRVTGTSDSSALTEETLRSLPVAFVGEIEQRPPAFSAVHASGRRLHELARAGGTPALPAPPRRVRVFSLDLVAFAPGRQARALVDAVCSPGTYLRSLADDIGRAAGCGACLSFLVRTRVGRFELAESFTLEELGRRSEAGTQNDLLLPLEWPLAHLPAVSLTAGQAKDFVSGTRVLSGAAEAWPARVHDPEGVLLGLGEVLAGGQLRPRVVLGAERGAEPPPDRGKQ